MRTAAPDAMKQYLRSCVYPRQFTKAPTTLKQGTRTYAKSGVKTTGTVR